MPLPSFLQRFRREPSAVVVPPTLSAADIEQVRTRARRRMIGMLVLVLLAVGMLSWLLETEPRRAPAAIEVVTAGDGTSEHVAVAAHPPAVMEPAPRPAITDRSGAQPREQRRSTPVSEGNTPPARVHDTLDEGEELVEPQPSKSDAPAPVRPSPAMPPKVASVTPDKPKPVPAPKPVPPKPVAKAKEEVKPATKPVVTNHPSTKTEAKPAEKPPTKVAEKGGVPEAAVRYVVQVGAFSDVAMARATRLKVEGLGIKTYTQVVETPTGRKIRVRVGPFTSEAQAQKALATVRKAGVAGGILTF